MIIFLYGEDSYRSKKKLEEIILEYKKIHKSGLNLIYLDTKNKSFGDFLDSFKIVSMFFEKKLVIIKNVFSAKGGPASGWQEEFIESIENIKNSEDVIVVYEDVPADQRTKIFKILKKHAKCQEFSLLAGSELKKWMRQEFEKCGSKITQEAEDLLFALATNDLWQIKNDIKKLANYKREGVIKKEDIELHVKPKIGNDIFKTIDAVAQKNKRQALELLHKHLDNGEAPLYLLSMMAYQFKNLLIIKELIDKKNPYQAIIKKSGLHPFVVKKNYYLCSQFSMVELKKIYRKIFQVDLNIKLGRVDPETALDILLAEI